MAFDPAAATAAYLASVPPEAQAKAVAYTQGGHWILLWGALVAIVAALIILKLGVLRKVQAKLERNKPRPLLTAFVLSLVFIALSALLTLPWDIYAEWARETSYGLTSQPLAGWLVERLIGIRHQPGLHRALPHRGLLADPPRAAAVAGLGGRAHLGLHAVRPVRRADLHRAHVQQVPERRRPGRSARWWSRWASRSACRPTRSTSTTAPSSPTATPPTSRACSARRGWR